jgi:hypothetical protein
MNTVDQFRRVFAEKLQHTSNMDEAFAKAVWVAYTEGLLEGLTTKHPEHIITAVEKVLSDAYTDTKELK